MTHHSTTGATRGRRKSEISYLNYAVVATIPCTPVASPLEPSATTGPARTLRLDEHLFPYEGCVMDRAEYTWGVYGTVSQRQALSMAEVEASKSESRNLVVQAVYQLNEPEYSRAQIDRDAMRRTGYFHVDRLQARFREEVKRHLLQAAQQRYDGFDQRANEGKSLTELLVDYPSLVQDIFEMDARVCMVVHQVRPTWNPTRKGHIHVCTMRRQPARISGVEVKYLPNIAVIH